MKMKTIALATVLAMTSTFALAQGTGGSSTSGAPAAASPTGSPQGDAAMQKNQGTIGTSRPSAAGDASTSGADTAAGTHSTGAATEPGAVKNGVNGK